MAKSRLARSKERRKNELNYRRLKSLAVQQSLAVGFATNEADGGSPYDAQRALYNGEVCTVKISAVATSLVFQ